MSRFFKLFFGSFRENKKKRSRQLSAISLSATRTLREQLSAIS
ncbi:hypothetical protein [Moorena sp. SIO4E2]|nr:hypothetical protein [Moorena sp. SIO4E2]